MLLPNEGFSIKAGGVFFKGKYSLCEYSELFINVRRLRNV